METNLEAVIQSKGDEKATMNGLYRGYLNAGGTESFKDFVENSDSWSNAGGRIGEWFRKANESGLISQVLAGAGAWANSKIGSGSGGSSIVQIPCLEGYTRNANGICIEDVKPMSTIAIVGISVGILALIGGIIYVYKTKSK